MPAVNDSSPQFTAGLRLTAPRSQARRIHQALAKTTTSTLRTADTLHPSAFEGKINERNAQVKYQVSLRAGARPIADGIVHLKRSAVGRGWRILWGY